MEKKEKNKTRRSRRCEDCGDTFSVHIEDMDTELCLKCQDRAYKELGGDY